MEKKINNEIKEKKNKTNLMNVESAGLEDLGEELAVDAVFVSSTSIIVHAAVVIEFGDPIFTDFFFLLQTFFSLCMCVCVLSLEVRIVIYICIGVYILYITVARE